MPGRARGGPHGMLTSSRAGGAGPGAVAVARIIGRRAAPAGAGQQEQQRRGLRADEGPADADPWFASMRVRKLLDLQLGEP